MRPFIPCHSAIQNPAAKYISKTLKLIVKSMPTIIHGTKDLVIKLSKIMLTPSRKFYIITGDVLAFYPSIPIDKCINIVTELYYEQYHEGKTPTMELGLYEAKIFIKCLWTTNQYLILQYEHKMYIQKRGLAMGIVDSPDLANLYGLFFDNTCNIHQHLLVPFYRRFIDIVFGIVYASSEAEAINIMNIVKFNDCVIEWGVSDLFLPFLDMTIYHNVDNRLQHMPYWKVHSHQERIPWISHHPLDVKKRNCNW